MLNLVTPVPQTAITLADVKLACRINTSAEDTLVQSYLDTAVAFVERSTGRSFSIQTYSEDLECFPGSERNWDAYIPPVPARNIILLINPLATVSSVTYFDGYNNAQTLDPSTYEVKTYTNYPGQIIPLTPFPSTYHRSDAVTVSYTGGWSEPPAMAVQAVYLLVAHWYAHRESEGDVTQELQVGLDRLFWLLDCRGYSR